MYLSVDLMMSTCRHEEDSENLTSNLSKSDVVRLFNHLDIMLTPSYFEPHVHLHEEKHVGQIENSGKPHKSERTKD